MRVSSRSVAECGKDKVSSSMAACLPVGSRDYYRTIPIGSSHLGQTTGCPALLKLKFQALPDLQTANPLAAYFPTAFEINQWSLCLACRAGLYKQLADLRALVSEYREDPANSQALRASIVGSLKASGLQEDCPFRPAQGAEPAEVLTAEAAEALDEPKFTEYVGRLYTYLQVWHCCTAAEQESGTK